MINKVFIGSFLLFLLTSCNKESVEFYVDPALSPYFDLFVEEAAARGITVDYAAAEVETAFVDLEEDVPAQCAHSSASPNLLRVDPDNWATLEAWEKEFLIFHELGHCYLGLGHNDSKDAGGNCQSIMHSSSTVCTNTFLEDRAQLLDELFK